MSILLIKMWRKITIVIYNNRLKMYKLSIKKKMTEVFPLTKRRNSSI